MGLDEILVLLVAREVLGKKVDDEGIKKVLTENSEALEMLYELSKMHDLCHIVCLALKHIGVWGKDGVFAKFQRQQNLAVYRCEQLNHESERVSKVLEKAEIPYIPLKGALIGRLYPEPWMRTSSDIDILVEKHNEQRAQELLKQECGYTLKTYYKSETAFLTDKGICIELHCIDETSAVRDIPEDVWKCSASENGTYRRTMSGEMLYSHVVAHLTKHILNNGCGLKPFLDMCILEKKCTLDLNAVENMLERQGLLKAYKALRQTAQSCFEDEEGNELTKTIYRYMILSGAYGNRYTAAGMNHKKRGGKFQYILSLFLPDREVMERRYPILKEHPKRLPLYHIKRWGHLIFHGKIKSSAEIISKHMAVPDDEVKKLNYMLKEMGLDKE